MPNHGTPKYLFRADLSGPELEAAAALLVERVLADAGNGPLTCPACGGTDVTARNGSPPTYRCACGHRWHTPVIVLGEETA